MNNINHFQQISSMSRNLPESAEVPGFVGLMRNAFVVAAAVASVETFVVEWGKSAGCQIDSATNTFNTHMLKNYLDTRQKTIFNKNVNLKSAL